MGPPNATWEGQKAIVWYDDLLSFSWPNVLVGVGVAILVRVILPAVAMW